MGGTFQGVVQIFKRPAKILVHASLPGIAPCWCLSSLQLPPSSTNTRLQLFQLPSISRRLGQPRNHPRLQQQIGTAEESRLLGWAVTVFSACLSSMQTAPLLNNPAPILKSFYDKFILQTTLLAHYSACFVAFPYSSLSSLVPAPNFSPQRKNLSMLSRWHKPVILLPAHLEQLRAQTHATMPGLCLTESTEN